MDKVAIIYGSSTGNTETVALNIAKIIHEEIPKAIKDYKTGVEKKKKLVKRLKIGGGAIAGLGVLKYLGRKKGYEESK